MQGPSGLGPLPPGLPYLPPSVKDSSYWFRVPLCPSCIPARPLCPLIPVPTVPPECLHLNRHLPLPQVVARCPGSFWTMAMAMAKGITEMAMGIMGMVMGTTAMGTVMAITGTGTAMVGATAHLPRRALLPGPAPAPAAMVVKIVVTLGVVTTPLLQPGPHPQWCFFPRQPAPHPQWCFSPRQPAPHPQWCCSPPQTSPAPHPRWCCSPPQPAHHRL